MRRALRGWLRSAALVLAAVFVPALAASQEPARPRPVSPADPPRPVSPADRPPPTDTLLDLLLEVSVERGGSQPMLGYQADTLVYLPLRTLLAFIEVRVVEALPPRRFVARSGDRPAFGIVTDEGRVYRGATSLPIPHDAAFWRGDELFVRLDLLSTLLEVEAVMQWSDLLVRISAADDLPLVRRLARERRRAAALRPQETERPVLLRSRTQTVDGLAVDWAVTAATRDPVDNSGLRLGIGGAVLGGGLDVQATVQNTPTATQTTTFWQWGIAWPERTRVRQVRLGDIATGGPRAFPIKGAEITNRPFLRDAAFAVEDLAGHLPAGWEIEVYRSGELVGYQPVNSGGVYALPVPIVYGPNPLDVVELGPNGETRRSERTFLVGLERLPARRFEYSASGGECASTRCQAALSLDARYGISSRLTVQAGVDHFRREGRDTLVAGRDTLPDLTHPYALASFALTRPLALTAEAVAGAFVRGRFDYNPTPDLRLESGWTRFDTTVVAPIIGDNGIRDQADGSLFWRPGILGGDFYAQANAAWQRGAIGTRTQLRAAGTMRVRGVRLTAGGRLQRLSGAAAGDQRTTGADVGGDAVITARGPLRNTLVRGTLSADCVDLGAGCRTVLSRWDAGLGRQLLRLLRLDLAVRYERGSPGVTLDIALQMATPWLRATSRNTVQSGTGVTGTQLLEGTLLWDRRSSRLGFSAGRNLGRAGIAGRVFLDGNGNGVRDGDDTVLPGILLRVGADAVVTDSAGRFSVWDLVPYTDALVEVDTLALENPLWVPATASARLVPVPNSFRFVDIPILQGGEIEGRVEMDGRPLPGAALTLLEESTLRRRRIATFTDATFYVMRLPPGRYVLMPAEGLLEQLHARADAVRFEVGGAGLMRHADLVVRIVRE